MAELTVQLPQFRKRTFVATDILPPWFYRLSRRSLFGDLKLRTEKIERGRWG